jgi:hypothetical protein
MLELQKWLFRLENPHWEFKWPHWDVFDPETDRQVGTVRQKQMNWTEYLRSWRGVPLEARTVPDRSLIFSLFKPIRLGRSRVQTLDASGELVGYFQPKIISVNSGYWVYDARGQVIGEVRGDWTQYEYQLLTPEGQKLGRVSRKLVGLQRAVLFKERDYAVTVGDEAKGRPEVKLLLLSTALAVQAFP